MEHIFYSFLVSTVLFFLYQTDVFVEYVRLLRLKRLFALDKYDNYVDNLDGGSYWDFLMFQKNCFVTRLISCPVCTSFWLNLALYFSYRDEVTFVLNLWTTLLLYFVLCVMYRKSHE